MVFFTPLRPSAYSTPELRGNSDNAIVGEVRHAIDPVGSRVATDIGKNPGATSGIGEVVMASLKAMQTMQTQMAAQVTQVTESIAGLSGSFEAHMGRAPRKAGEN